METTNSAALRFCCRLQNGTSCSADQDESVEAHLSVTLPSEHKRPASIDGIFLLKQSDSHTNRANLRYPPQTARDQLAKRQRTKHRRRPSLLRVTFSINPSPKRPTDNSSGRKPINASVAKVTPVAEQSATYRNPLSSAIRADVPPSFNGSSRCIAPKKKADEMKVDKSSTVSHYVNRQETQSGRSIAEGRPGLYPGG